MRAPWDRPTNSVQAAAFCLVVGCEEESVREWGSYCGVVEGFVGGGEVRSLSLYSCFLRLPKVGLPRLKYVDVAVNIFNFFSSSTNATAMARMVVFWSVFAVISRPRTPIPQPSKHALSLHHARFFLLRGYQGADSHVCCPSPPMAPGGHGGGPKDSGQGCFRGREE